MLLIKVLVCFCVVVCFIWVCLRLLVCCVLWVCFACSEFCCFNGWLLLAGYLGFVLVLFDYSCLVGYLWLLIDTDYFDVGEVCFGGGFRAGFRVCILVVCLVL